MQIKLQQWCNDFTDYLQQSPIRAESHVPNMISQDALQNIKKVESDLLKIQKKTTLIPIIGIFGEKKSYGTKYINIIRRLF